MKIGFVGLGIMGAPMAANLIKADFEVAVYDRVRAKCEPLEALGAPAADSPAVLAADRDVVITIVPDTPDVEEVLFGADGLAGSLRPGAVVIDMSTISARATVEFANRLRQKSAEMLDAPVSGGEPGAREARLSIMVGGERAVFDRCLPLFEAMGKNIVYAGENGNGQKTKMVNQVVGSLNLLAAVEGMRLAAATGLDLPQTLEAVGSGAAGSWMWSNIGPLLAAQDHRPGFMVRLHAKDLRLADELRRELDLDAPGTVLCHKLFQRAVEQGFGKLGNQGLIRLWEQSA
ncbi:MAG: NAD(P)-dependent oxidoreductase [bacterium]|nr:NAD(P)-dependent oxidoreductase [bacterium]